MPTNVSQPDWRCNVCRTRFGTDLATAERCEAAGVPAVLPPGELMLSYQERRWDKREQGFYLRRLYPLPLDFAVGTVASKFDQKTGHFPYYYADVNPVDYIEGGVQLRFPPNWPQQRRIQGDWLSPHLPGHLNQEPGTLRSGGVPHTKNLRWIADAVGLAVDGTPLEPSLSDRLVRPLTEPVRAVLDALDTRIRFAETDLEGTRIGSWWTERNGIGALALEACRTKSGASNKRWAQTWLHGHPHAALLADLNERWRRWRAGELVTVPFPAIRCRVQLHASKLNKAMKQLVAATGVEWPARTTSDEYVRLLLDKTLEYKMETTDRLFDVPELIAVTGTKGGVGKSSVAAALARRLAGEGRRVALIDCDLTGPSQHVLFDLGPARTDPQQGRVLLSPTDLPGLAVFSPAQVFGPGAVEWNATTIADWLRFVGSSVALDGVDVVVLDLPPGESTVHQLVFHDGDVNVTASVHVTTGHPLALADTERGLATLNGHLTHLRHRGRVPVLVENLSRATGVDADGRAVEIRLVGDDDAVRDLAERHQMLYGGSLPWCPDVAVLADSDEVARLAGAVIPVGAEVGVAGS